MTNSISLQLSIRIFLLFLFFLSMYTSGHAQHRIRLHANSLEIDGLRGKVKQMNQYEYEPEYAADSSYQLIPYDLMTEDNYTAWFSESGFQTIKEELGFDFDSNAFYVKARWNYGYDSFNRITQEKRISLEFGKDTIVWKYSYLNDSTTRIIQYDKTYDKLFYTYIQTGQKEILNFANSDSSYMKKTMFFYDSAYHIIRKEEYNEHDEITFLNLIEYDSANFEKWNLNLSLEFGWRSNVITVNDSLGNPVQKIFQSLSETDYSANRFEYQYDERGNWIEKKCYNPENRIYTVYKREFTYY